MTPSGPLTFNFAGRRTFAGPCGLPRARRQDASTLLLQPTFASRAPGVDITSRDLPPSAVGVSPRAFDGLSRAAALLDGTRAGFGPIDAASRCALALHSARAPALFRRCGGSVDRDPLTPRVSAWTEYGEPYSSQSPDLGSPRARQ